VVGDNRRVYTSAARARVVASAALLALVLGGCGTPAAPISAQPEADPAAASTSTSSQPPAVSTPGPAGETPPAGSTAPEAPAADMPEQLDFTATTVSGEPFAGAEVAGEDVLFYFWAPWCAVCRRTAPALAEFAAGRDDVRLVTVGGSSQDVDAMAGFVADVGLDDFVNVADTTGEIWTRFGVTYQYTYVFVDDGGTVEVVTGPLDEAELTTRYDALVAA